ncbi:D-alanyl-D-alanine carboxypeptidase/D-alanyl-D-alanine-endopeptidase [Bdellovibrio sp. HCB337]|uniref:D-alanyl-D-alanine carboxypeptidase/D-alanyl-D-alanine endopeptidase n=1 Tax=Bdellovibrio sp. HCB337 TaxID=3394358 RepID=UPI0039A69617
MKLLRTCLLSFLLSQPVLAQENFKTELQKIIKRSGIPESDLGLYITAGEGEHQEIILDVNSKKKMIPASISKVATASAVLEYFPPGYKFKTQLLSAGDIQDKTLKGDLVLKGSGDPGFVSENMWFLVNNFKRSEITKVEGDLVVDDSLFDQKRYDSSRQPERVDRAYDAPVGAMSFNWNSINIFVRPGNKAGEAAKVFLDPENEYVRLVNKTTTTSGSDNNVVASRVEDKTFGGDVIHVSGKIGVNSKEVVIFKNITQPDLWAGYNLKSFLSQRGITITGKIRIGKASDKAVILAEAESKAIEQAVADMNKFSNNYVAEMLTKNMGALKKQPGSLDTGMEMINEHLKKLGLPDDQYYFQNPSGLTRDNKISPFGMWKVILHLKNDFKVQPEFLTSLPIAGIDGTLKRRMKNSPGERWVRAKTGYLTNVVSLAGYAGRSDGRVFTFTFIFNGTKDEASVRNFFDQMLIALLK